ncbi:phosphoribosylanthranilate isomerase [Lichenicola sp.]|uniref:phosphoribosylanthranilate isomerase n=1 Tax=Lichenicola sp. TaxID=2804529 RepID=UPI003AFFB884
MSGAAPSGVRRVGVKVCGIRDEVGLDAAIDAGVDWVGFVFFARSPRVVTPREASRLHARLQGRIPSVGLFVEPDDAEIALVLETVPLEILQLYTDPDRAAAVRARFGLPVWLAHGVSGREQLPRESRADGLVIESRPPRDANRPGGNGVAFDWSILAGWSAPAPWLLAGGLTADNVGSAIAASGAPAVDVSSGVESRPGQKDADLIRRFVSAARGGPGAVSSPAG